MGHTSLYLKKCVSILITLMIPNCILVFHYALSEYLSVTDATGCSAETCHVYSKTLLSKCCVMQVTALALSKHKNSVKPLVIPSS